MKKKMFKNLWVHWSIYQIKWNLFKFKMTFKKWIPVSELIPIPEFENIKLYLKSTDNQKYIGYALIYDWKFVNSKYTKVTPYLGGWFIEMSFLTINIDFKEITHYKVI